MYSDQEPLIGLLEETRDLLREIELDPRLHEQTQEMRLRLDREIERQRKAD
jgi:hypothetical protein